MARLPQHSPLLVASASASAAALALALAITTPAARAAWILYYPWSAHDMAVGNGRMVASGWNTSGIRTTTDGINWTTLSDSVSGESICYGNGYFWISPPGFNLYRTDGVSAPSIVTTNFSSSQLAFGKGLLLRGKSGGIAYSPDGITWQNSVLPVTLTSDPQLEFIHGIFIATGAQSLITSEDGITWTLRPTPSTSGAVPKHIAHDGSSFLVTDWNGTKHWRSPDGITWTEFSGGPGFAPKALHFANGLFYVVGSDGKISTSPTGAVWTPQASGVTVTLQAIGSIAGQVIVAGPDQLLRKASEASVPMPPITIRPALELEFHAEDSVSYRIEGSADLTSWTAVETGIVGHGGPVKRKYSATGQPYRYFRAVAE